MYLKNEKKNEIIFLYKCTTKYKTFFFLVSIFKHLNYFFISFYIFISNTFVMTIVEPFVTNNQYRMNVRVKTIENFINTKGVKRTGDSKKFHDVLCKRCHSAVMIGCDTIRRRR